MTSWKSVSDVVLVTGSETYVDKGIALLPEISMISNARIVDLHNLQSLPQRFVVGDYFVAFRQGKAPLVCDNPLAVGLRYLYSPLNIRAACGKRLCSKNTGSLQLQEDIVEVFVTLPVIAYAAHGISPG